MRNLALLLPCIFLLSIGQKSLAADDFKRLFHEAQILMFNENYEVALPILIKLDSMQANNANILYQIGILIGKVQHIISVLQPTPFSNVIPVL